MKSLVVVVLGVAVPTGLLAADPRPVTQPSRDVEVVYTVSQGDRQLEERARFQGATGLQRLDSPTGAGSYMIANAAAGIVSMISDVQHSVIVLPRPANPLDGAPAAFQKFGRMTIAGLDCTEWLVTPFQVAHAVPNMICLTADGVMLSLRIGGDEKARAATVTYKPIDAAVFAVPNGYTRMTGAPATP